MLQKQLYLKPANAKTLYDRKYRNIIDYEITSDLQLIIAYYEYSYIVIWKINSNYKETEIQATMREITCLAISPNNRYFAVGGHSPSIIQIFEIKCKTNSITLRHHANVETLNFSQNSKYLFTISKDLILVIWNLQQQSLVKSIKLTDKQYFFSNLLSGPTIAQMFNKYSRRFALTFNTKYKEQNQQLTSNIFNNIITQITPNSCKILTWHQKMIRCKKYNGINSAKFIKENIYIKFDNQSVIIFQTATMRLLTSISNEYGFQRIKLVTLTNLMIIGFNIFGIKYWVF